MSHNYDPRKLLKQISNVLLQEFFMRHDVLQELPWEELSEKQMEPVFSAWRQLDDIKRKAIQVVLQDVQNLADARGLKIFTEELCRHYPQHVETFAALHGPHDQALWAYLHLPQVFKQAALFARADALQGGRYWVKRNSLPRGQLKVDEGSIGKLQRALHKYYWSSEMRGKHCKVEYYDRASGGQYFYAYLDDWPDKQLVFADDGQMAPQSRHPAFANVFVFNPSEGSLELAAKGGAAVHLPLQKAFCRSVLGLEVEPALPLRPVYRLDALLEPGFAFSAAPHDRIAQVFLRRVRTAATSVDGHAVDYLEMKFAADTEPAAAIAALRHCGGTNIVIHHATFELVFLADARQRVKKMSFSVTLPHTCNLKSKPDEMREIGERCLKLWQVVDA